MEEGVPFRVGAAQSALDTLGAELDELARRIGRARARADVLAGPPVRGRSRAGPAGPCNSQPAAGAHGRTALQYSFDTIGVIRSCFGQKFGTPRQPGLAPGAIGELVLLPPWSQPDAVRGIRSLWRT